MFCSQCGGAIATGAAFCARCGAPATPTLTPAGGLKRPGVVTLLAILQWVGGSISVRPGRLCPAAGHRRIPARVRVRVMEAEALRVVAAADCGLSRSARDPGGDDRIHRDPDLADVIGPAGRSCANARDGSRPASSRRTASRRHVHMGWYSYTVAYIITEPCIGTKDTACVD